MSKKSNHEISCSHCGKKFTKEIHHSYNTLLDKNVASQIMSFNDFILECPHCKEITYYNHSLLYNDMLNNIMVQYTPTLQEAYECINNYEKLNQKYQLNHKLRVVFSSVTRFIEKVLILSMGYNDMVMELYKLIFISESDVAKEDEVFITFNDELTKCYVSVLHEDKSTTDYEFNEKMYEYLYSVLETKEYFNRANDYFVDLHFIEKIIDDESNSEPLHIEVFNGRKFIGNVYVEELNSYEKCICDNYKENDKVNVKINDKTYTGIIEEIRLLSEQKLGCSFESLPKIISHPN